MTGRRRSRRDASAARTAVIFVTAAAVVCLIVLGGWMVRTGNNQTAGEAAGAAPADSRTDGGQSAAGQQEKVLADTVIELTTAENGDSAGNDTADESEERQNHGEAEPSGDITLLFAGDVYFSEHVMDAYRRAGGIGGVLDAGIRAEIEAADLFTVNQEFPFTSRGTAAEDKQFTFRVPPEKVSMLTEMGVGLVTMANNHILDFGPEGITDSLAALDGAGILHVGAGEDLEQAKKLEIVEIKGKKIGFLGVSRVYMAASWAAGAGHPGVFSTYDPSLALEEIRAARPQCDYLVVYVHWGIERNTTPEDYQRSMGRQYIDAGADLVVGSHPHVLQEIEYYDGKPIAYSLGNFVFGSSIPETELLKVVLRDAEGNAAVGSPESGDEDTAAGLSESGSADAAVGLLESGDADAATGLSESGGADAAVGLSESGDADAAGNMTGDAYADSAAIATGTWDVEVTTIPCTSSGGYTRLR